MSNKLPFVLGLIGGILLVVTETVGNIGLWNLLPLIGMVLGLPPEVVYTVNLLLTILRIIAGAGGIAVICGSFLLLFNRVRWGKFIITLGAGFGIFSLILLFFGFFASGFTIVAFPLLLLETPSVIGLILSLLARFIAKEEKT
jgi:hypothetical protein